MTATAIEQRTGDWLQTYTGRAFWPLDPRPEEVDPVDIAHALGMICRYAGHVRSYYSVAEHCVLMSRAVTPRHALWALLHDATEAYLLDLPRPVKYAIPQYREIEDQLMAVICRRFALDPVPPAEIKEADTRILVDERHALLGPPPLPWKSTENVAALGVTIRCWTPAQAAAAWLDRFTELTAGG